MLSTWQTRTLPQQKLQNFCHGLPNGPLTIHLFSLYSNPYSTTRLTFLHYFALWLLYPKTSHDFSFSQDSSILLLMSFPTWPLPPSPYLPCVTYHLTHFSALTGFAQACFCFWFPFILFSAPGKPLVSVRVPAADKTVAPKSLSRWRDSTEVWSAFGGMQQVRSLPSVQKEERTCHLEEGLPDKWRGWCSCCQAGIRGRTTPSVPSYLLLESIPLAEPTGSQRSREAVHGSQLSKTWSRKWVSEWVCVCVCVCVRERERERENNQRIKLSPLIQIATFTFVFSAPWKMNWSASYCI